MSTKAQELESGCFAAALPDEPMFVLLARDSEAPHHAREWAYKRNRDIVKGLRPRADMAKVNEALDCAEEMERWRLANDGAWRK